MRILAVLVALLLAVPAGAHSGGTNANGCHQQGGVVHCHGLDGGGAADGSGLIWAAVGIAVLGIVLGVMYLQAHPDTCAAPARSVEGPMPSSVVRAGVQPSDPDDFTPKNDGTIFQRSTMLLWQRTAHDARFSYEEAVAYCAALSLAGGGWRLPEGSELRTIVHGMRCPTVIYNAFPDTPCQWFWSATISDADPGRAWSIDFEIGEEMTRAKNQRQYVRCVR